MKELSIEEKARRYDEAIEKAKGVIEQNPLMEYLKKGIEYILPELKESEDDKTKRILHSISSKISFHLRDIFTEEEFQCFDTWSNSWLEKLDTDISLFSIEQRKYMEKYISLDKVTLIKLLAERDKNVEEITESFEKQGKQKPAEKVEPKFKVGDWVVTDKNGIVCIKSIDDSNYVLSNTMRFTIDYVDKCWHLWTIQDAKDGDVLVCESGWTCIFKKLNHNSFGETLFDSYCFIDRTGWFCDGAKGHTLNERINGKIYPAIKEQGDLLFAKMKEAGYEWDAEKKELKKIEQNPANVFNIYEKPLLEKFKQAAYDCAWGKVTCKTEGETQEEYAERWAEHLLILVRDWADDYIDNKEDAIARRAYDKGKQDIQKPAWSEEDEKMLNHIIGLLEGLPNLHNWLKSLKDRYTWKPSEEQIECLHDAINHYHTNGYPASKLNELYEQMSKIYKL